MEGVNVSAEGAEEGIGGPADTTTTDAASPDAEAKVEQDEPALTEYMCRILEVLQPGESVLGALRRLSHLGTPANAAPSSSAAPSAQRAQHERMKTGRTVPPENKCATLLGSRLCHTVVFDAGHAGAIGGGPMRSLLQGGVRQSHRLEQYPAEAR